MPVKAIYDVIANHYSSADCFGSITKSHSSAIQQIKASQICNTSGAKILDLGVGDGAFLRKIRPLFPHSELTGIDVSPEMLKCASNNLSLNTIETSAAEASRYIPLHSQDLTLAHFINAYVPIDTLFNQAYQLTKPNGYFSFITTTYESFQTTQQYLADFIARESILSSIVGHYYKAVVKNTTVAAGEEELLNTFQKHRFDVVEHQRLRIPVSFNNVNELVFFGVEGTWFVNTVAFGILPKNFILNRFKKLSHRMLKFPYQDTHVVDIVLAKK